MPSETMNNEVIYPNPADDNITIYAEEFIQQVSIINMQGGKMKHVKPENARIKIDSSDLPNGFYLIEIVYNDGVRSVNKILKQ